MSDEITYEEHDKLRDVIDKKRDALGGKELNDKINKLHAESDSLQEERIQIRNEIYSEDTVWTLQPVHSLHAGPFEVMDQLVSALIHEGFKKILIISCNSGHHALASEIQNTKGVIIRHATNFLLSESTMAIESSEFYTLKKFYPVTIAYAAKDIDKGAELEIGYKFKGENDNENDGYKGSAKAFFDEHEFTPLAHVIEYDKVGNLMLVQTNDKEYSFVASKNIKEGDKLKVNWDCYKTYFGDRYKDIFGESALLTESMDDVLTHVSDMQTCTRCNI
jgi:hypothetical protein